MNIFLIHIPPGWEKEKARYITALKQLFPIFKKIFMHD